MLVSYGAKNYWELPVPHLSDATLKDGFRVIKMVQQIKPLSCKPDMSSIPRAQAEVKGGNQCHMWTTARMPTNTQ